MRDAFGFELHDGDTVQFDTETDRLWGTAIVDGSPEGLLLVELDPGQGASGVHVVAPSSVTLIGGDR